MELSIRPSPTRAARQTRIDDVEWVCRNDGTRQRDGLSFLPHRRGRDQRARRHHWSIFPDTVFGYTTPEETPNSCATLIGGGVAPIPTKAKFFSQCIAHNDLGIGRWPIRWRISAGGGAAVKCTVNGIGERAGKSRRLERS